MGNLRGQRTELAALGEGEGVMWVRGVDLREVVSIDRGAEGIRVNFVDGSRKFVGGEEGVEVWNAWHFLLQYIMLSWACPSFLQDRWARIYPFFKSFNLLVSAKLNWEHAAALLPDGTM